MQEEAQSESAESAHVHQREASFGQRREIFGLAMGSLGGELESADAIDYSHQPAYIA